MGYATNDKKQPKLNDSSVEQWVLQNSMFMSLLFNFMNSTHVSSYILYDTAAQIQSAIKQTYSHYDNYAEVFDIHQKIHGLKQRELTVTYIMSEW